MRRTHTQIWVALMLTACCVIFCAPHPAFADTLYDTAVSYWAFDETNGLTAEDGVGDNDGTLNAMAGDEWTGVGLVML